MKRIINGLPLKTTYNLLDQEERKGFNDFLCVGKGRTISGFALSSGAASKVTVSEWRCGNPYGEYHELDNDKPLSEQLEYLFFKNNGDSLVANFRCPIARCTKITFDSSSDSLNVSNRISTSITSTAKEATELAEYLNTGIFDGDELVKFFSEFDVTIDHCFIAIDCDRIIIETSSNFGEGTYLFYNPSMNPVSFSITRMDAFGTQLFDVAEITLDSNEYIRHDLKNNDEISFSNDYRSILIGKVL